MIPAPLKQKILIIEDSTFTRESMAKYLTNIGYDVTACELQSQAVPLIKDRNSFDLILLDGWTDVCKTIMTNRANEKMIADSDEFLTYNMNKGIPVMMISASREHSMRSARLSPDVVTAYDKSRMDFGDMGEELMRIGKMVERELSPKGRSQSSGASVGM